MSSAGKKILLFFFIFFLFISYFSFCIYYNLVRVPEIGYCVGASENQEKFFECTIGNPLRKYLGININADYIHAGELVVNNNSIKENARHMMLLLRIDFWGFNVKTFWESTLFMPVTKNYMKNWDYYRIVYGDYLDGKPIKAYADDSMQYTYFTI